MKKTHNNNRSERIASTVQRHIAEILRDNYADDPVLSGVSIVGAESHGGLAFARLYYYTREQDTDQRAQTQKRLEHVKTAIRTELAARMDQKYVPDIGFTYDDTLEKSKRIEELLANAEK